MRSSLAQTREGRARSHRRAYPSLVDVSALDERTDPRKSESSDGLAQQWSAEDEEELERERRRRHRQLSSSSEVKDETPEPVKNVVSKAPNRFRNSSEVKSSKLGNSKLENERRPVETLNKVEDKWVRRRVEALNNVKQEKKETVNARKLGKEDDEENTKSLAESAQKQKDSTTEKQQAQSQQKVLAEEKHQNRVQEKWELRKGKCENLNQEEKDLKVGEDEVFNQKPKVLGAQESPVPVTLQNEGPSKLPQRASWERRSISRLEVKINSRVRSSSEAAPATPASGSRVSSKSISKIDEVESSPSGSEAASLVTSPVITYSSSFKRITPRTISFRVVSKKDQQEDTLSRSASMRLPASSGKLEQKLEKYTSAVQRAGSIKLPPSARRNFQPPSEGVASKRSIFEAHVRTEPTTPIRKESLKIPGAVTSRINLWISRTQEPSKDEGAKDIQKMENTAQQSQWRKQSGDS
ncbi:ladinin-1 [Tiliqua scincoides]|uniref:ladinin-1 n=1 Tax=Tiliqua scincoides TaxID=71010 RepID=UPI0034625B05